jgi:hypothetical protein
MMSLRRAPAAAITVVALVLSALPSRGVAAAGTELRELPGWPAGSACAQGTLTGGARTEGNPVRTPLIAQVWACEGADPAYVARSRWTIAEFFDTAAYPGGSGIGRIPSATVVTNGYADGDLVRGELGPVRAACIITWSKRRIACVRITAVGAAGTISIEPMPTNDPYVGRAVPLGEVNDEPNPGCAACV